MGGSTLYIRIVTSCTHMESHFFAIASNCLFGDPVNAKSQFDCKQE